MLVGLRTAAALPADLNARWVFQLQRPRRRDLHAGLERSLFVLGVLPAVCMGVATAGPLWGLRVAALHGLLLIAVGGLFIQMLLWLNDAMPCAHPWEPERLDLRRRWLLYLAVFVAFTAGIAVLERALLASTVVSVSFALAIASAAAVVRYVSLRLPPRLPAEAGYDAPTVALRLHV